MTAELVLKPLPTGVGVSKMDEIKKWKPTVLEQAFYVATLHLLREMKNFHVSPKNSDGGVQYMSKIADLNNCLGTLSNLIEEYQERENDKR